MKSTQLHLILAIVISFSLFACKAKQKTSSNPASNQLVFTLKKTACYGSCPIFTLNIFEDGEIIFEGEKFTEKTGKYKNQINSNEVNNLITEFLNANFFDFKDEYTAEMTDLPTTYLTFTHKGTTKIIRDYYGSPEKLKTLENTIDRYRKLENWIKIENKD